MSFQLRDTKPILDKAIEWVRQYVRQQSLGPGDRIASVRTLASMAGVSYVTMCNALRSLAMEGLLISANNRRYRLAEPAGIERQIFATSRKQPEHASDLEPWQRVESLLKADILNGAFKPGQRLPTIKELQRRYGVSYPTVVKALNRLVSLQILLRQINGSYYVPSFAVGMWRPTVVCFVTSADRRSLAFGQHDEAVFRELESQCEQSRIKVDIQRVFFDRKLDYHRYQSHRTGEIYDAGEVRRLDEPSVLGYVYLIPWFPRDTDRRAIDELTLLKKTVVVMDETALLNLSSQTLRRPGLRLISAAVSAEPGRQVARHLISLGHRRVAFISTDGDCLWSRLRLQGMQEEFARGGEGMTVVPFLAQAEINVYEHNHQKCNFSLLDTAYAEWRKDLSPDYLAEMDFFMERLHVDGSQRGEIRTVLKPLVEQALSDTSITAWVTANDHIATLAMSFLKTKNIDIPHDLSLVSFDDSPLAVRHQFSSYNFNPAALASFILGAVIGRRPFAEPGASVLGFIVDRGTTARPRTHITSPAA